jgi:hypothetical protein
LPPKAERVAGQGNPIAISTVLGKPAVIATTSTSTPEEIQQRRLARLFFLTPQTAAAVAELAYGGAA